MFSSRYFMVSGLMLKSFIHFEVDLAYGEREQSRFIFFAHRSPVFPAAFIEETILVPLHIFLLPGLL